MDNSVEVKREKNLFILHPLNMYLEDQTQKNMPIREYSSTKYVVF